MSKTVHIGRHALYTTLFAAQELIVIELCRLLLRNCPWMLLVVTRRFINPDVSRSGLKRLLQREGLGSLGSLRAMRAARAKTKEEVDTAPRKSTSTSTRPECP
ncbi:MAG: hypothetical protein LBD68_00590, partial [Zoogloeaceae bacterium]|nr:hypothetical protein [Zoogloeaceae bacterium]